MPKVHTKKQYPKHSTRLREDITDGSQRLESKRVLSYVCHLFYLQIKIWAKTVKILCPVFSTYCMTLWSLMAEQIRMS